ncbi:hypothetical protein [Larkinella rosea]|uniref:Uncharacterized protein n=1 Tax=Larkinella rosea TaxID=2025312 RepID=A0A3P1BTS6_9BACT|nr:hypothetical protein [Larkinella rosea]RRB04313.1 hypothetical protein EHT25_12435 [Larkinella rosea]
MNKFTLLSIVVGIVGIITIGASGGGRKAGRQTALADTLIIIRKDSLYEKFLKDSAYKAMFQRDTTMRIDTAALRAQADSHKVALPEVLTGELNGLAVCAGSPVSVPYTSSGGRFSPDNKFVLQLVDASGKVTNLSEPTKAGPFGNGTLAGVIPVTTAAGSRYSLRVASTNPVVNGTAQSLRVLPVPGARIELPDGSNAVTVLPGQPATFRVALSGHGPWSFVLSDGTKVQNTMTTPYEITVTPEKPTIYKVVNVSGPCGSGAVSGEIIVNVNENPNPEITLKAPNGGYRICTGTPFQVAFTATGRYQAGNGFVAQLADSTENWTTISGSGTASPLTARLPYGISPKGAYKIRVVATLPAISSNSENLAVAAQAVAVLRNDTIKIEEGKTAELNIDFGGGGPWFVLLTDGTYENNITRSPHTIRVTPNNPTGYAITSAGGACGVGEYSGRAFVKVNIPPSTITTGNLSARTICHGAEITVPFTTAGRFYANNKYVVQVADTSGRFVNLATTYKDGVLKATITPAYLKDTLNTVRLRVASTSPAVAGSETTIKILAPNVSQAIVAGEGTIRPGQTSKVRVAFKNGLPPWSFVLSDGTQVNGTFLNPYILTVAPTSSAEYTITSLKSSCGVGIPMGSARVTVERN